MSDYAELYATIHHALRGYVPESDITSTTAWVTAAVARMAGAPQPRPVGACPSRTRFQVGDPWQYCVFDFNHTGAHRDNQGVTWKDAL